MTRIIRGRGQRTRSPAPAEPERGAPPQGPLQRRGTRVIRAAQQDALRVADSLLADAQAHAKQIREQALADAAAVHEQALSEGRREALQLLLAVEQQRREHLAQAEPELLQLAVRIAEKIIGAQLTLRPESVRDVAAQCLRAAQGSGAISVRVNPADLPLLEQDLAALRAAGETEGLSLVADATLARGGCVIETPSGEIDGRIAAQLDTVRAALGGEDQTR